jgi:hypothetical protein
MKSTEVEFMNGVLIEVSGHKLLRLKFFLTFIPCFFSMLFIKRLEFSCFTDFFYKFLKPE